MEVVRHQAVREHEPALPVGDHAEEIEEVLAVLVVSEDRLAADTAAEDVEEPTDELKARLPSHSSIITTRERPWMKTARACARLSPFRDEPWLLGT
jgi:hypothetical protein